MDSRPSRGAARWHEDSEAEYARLAALGEAAYARREPTNDDLRAAITASLTIGEEHKAAIYRGEGVPPADALRGIEVAKGAALAGIVALNRLAALPSEPPSPDTERLDVALDWLRDEIVGYCAIFAHDDIWRPAGADHLVNWLAVRAARLNDTAPENGS